MLEQQCHQGRTLTDTLSKCREENIKLRSGEEELKAVRAEMYDLQRQNQTLRD